MKKIFLLILLLVVGFSNVNGQTYTGMEFDDNGKPKSIKTYKSLSKPIKNYQNPKTTNFTKQQRIMQHG